MRGKLSRKPKGLWMGWNCLVVKVNFFVELKAVQSLQQNSNLLLLEQARTGHKKR